MYYSVLVPKTYSVCTAKSCSMALPSGRSIYAIIIYAKVITSKYELICGIVYVFILYVIFYYCKICKTLQAFCFKMANRYSKSKNLTNLLQVAESRRKYRKIVNSFKVKMRMKI